jgi:hypothetical protein
MGYMKSAVAYPPEFALIDKAINDPNVNLQTAFIDRLGTGPGAGPAFGAGGIMVGDAQARTHWLADWVGQFPNGPGGAFWPYLTEIDVALKLRDGLTTSTTKVINTNRTKQHQMIWICFEQPDPSWLGSVPGNPVSSAKQKTMFNVAILETVTMIYLVVSTPNPLPDAKLVHVFKASSTVVPSGLRKDHTWWQGEPTDRSEDEGPFVWRRAVVRTTDEQLAILEQVGLRDVGPIDGETLYVEERDFPTGPAEPGQARLS